MSIFLDIETIPAGDPIDPMTMTPPGNISKQETIDAWYRDKAPALAAEKYRARALDSMQGEIICIGYAVDDHESCCMYSDEKSLLSGFSAEVCLCREECHESIHFIGWNIVAFDIPFLWRKAIKYGLRGLRDAFNRERYKGNALDLMNVWGTDWKDYRKLEDVARFLEVPGECTKVTGATVYDAYIAGDMDGIVAHCKNDVETVRAIYRRIFE